MTKEHLKPTRGRPSMPTKETESIFETDYAASKKDLEALATKLDLAKVHGSLTSDIKDLEMSILKTMATKTEMRMLIGGLYLLMIIGLGILTYMGYGGK